MLLPFSSREESPPSGKPSVKVSPRRRRGATAMEYLFVISLILVVAITGVGYFGQMLNNTATNTANAIENATKDK